MSDRDLAYATIEELGKQIRSGETTPTKLATFFLERLDSIGRKLNAVVTLTPDHALAQARRAEAELASGLDRGPLHGIPYGAKDLLSVRGFPTTWGAVPFKAQTFDYDAAVIERLNEAGAVLVAKLSMVEIAGGFGYEQPNASITGPGKSSWSENAWTGGSSSGSGSAVGAGCVPFAIGSETWGSIHCPSAFNGLTGLRPTYGRVSRRGAMALSWTMDKIGPMAHTVEDCWTVFQAIAGFDAADPTSSDRALPSAQLSAHTDQPKFKFGALRGATDGIQNEVAANFEASLDVLRQIGTIEEVDLPDLPWDAAAGTMITAEASSAFEEFITSGELSGLTAPEDQIGLYHGLTLPAVDYLRALRVRRLGSRKLDELLAGYDAVLAPSMPIVAPPIEETFANWISRRRGQSLGGPGNLCGLPSIAVPNGFGERGLPTSLEFLGRAYEEDRIAEAARAYQARTDWHRQRPNW